MIGKSRTGTLGSLMVVMIVGALLHAQTAVACAMPDPEPSMPCCLEHCEEAIAESNGCAEPVLSKIVVEVRGTDIRIDGSRSPSTDDAPEAGVPPDDWVALVDRRPRPEPLTDSRMTDGAHGAVYLITRRIRI